MSLDAIPASVQSFLVSEGILTAEQAASDWWTAFDAVPSGLKAIVYGMCQEADDEAQLTALKAELQAVIDQIKINNLAAQVWQAHKEIAAADWPASETLQEEIAALLTTDTSDYPPPGDPPEPPDPDSLDPVKRAAQISSLTAALASANAILDKLAAGAETSSVGWPTNASVQFALTDWLTAQGIPSADLAPDCILPEGASGASILFDDPHMAETWSWALDEGSFYRIGAADAKDAGLLVLYKDGQFHRVMDVSDPATYRWNDVDVTYDTHYWAGRESGTEEGRLFKVNGYTKKFFVAESVYLNNAGSCIFQSLIPDELGLQKRIDGKSVQLWSSGTTVYEIHRDVFGAYTVGTLNAALASDPVEPWTAFAQWEANINGVEKTGLTVYNGLTTIDTVTAKQRSSWSDFFEDKLGAVTASTNGFSMLMSTEATRAKEMVTTWENASEWLSYQLKIWAAALKCFSSRL